MCAGSKKKSKLKDDGLCYTPYRMWDTTRKRLVIEWRLETVCATCHRLADGDPGRDDLVFKRWIAN